MRTDRALLDGKGIGERSEFPTEQRSEVPGRLMPAYTEASQWIALHREHRAACEPCGQEGRENDLPSQAAVFVSTPGDQPPLSHATFSCGDRI